MLAYLHHPHAIAYDRLSRLMSERFGLAISEGAIANALRRACGPLTRAGTQIAATLREAAAEVIGCDETGARLSTDTLGTPMAWEWVLVGDRAVLHRIRPSRGRDVIDELMAGHRPRCRVADRWAAQQSLPRRRPGTVPRPVSFAWPMCCAMSSTPSTPASLISPPRSDASCAGLSRSADGERN